MDRPPRPVTLPSLEPGTSSAIRRSRSESRAGPRDSFAQRQGLGWEPQYGYTAPARDFAIA